MKAFAGTIILAAVVIVGWFCVGAVQPSPTVADGTLKGGIIKVELEAKRITVEPRGSNTKSVIVPFNAKTVVLVNDKEATPADLKAGHRVRVTLKDGIATKIEAREFTPPTQPSDQEAAK